MKPVFDHAFFDGLSEEHNDVVRRIARVEWFEDGELLFNQGDIADSAYFILRGRVRVQTRVPGGADVELTQLRHNQIVGELALIENSRRSARAIACGGVEAICIDSRDLSALCAHYHPASLMLMHRLAVTVAGRIRDTAESATLSLIDNRSLTSSQQEITEAATFDIRPFLPHLDFFREFSQHDIDAFSELCRPFTVSRGVLLNNIGDSPHSIWLLVRGSVESCLKLESGIFRTAVLGPGRLAGETGWLLEGDTPFISLSLTGCTLMELPISMRDDFLSPESHLSFRFYQALLRSLMKRLGSQARDFARKEQIRLSGASSQSGGSANHQSYD